MKVSKLVRGLVAAAVLLPAASVWGGEGEEEAAPRARSFPHNPAEARKADDMTCSVCHSAVPETGAAPEAANLRMPPDQACAMCHRGDMHHGVVEHLGKVVSEEVRATLPPEIALMGGEKVACFSCHEVHTVETDPAVLRRIEEARERGRPLADALRAEALKGEWAALGALEPAWPGAGDPRVQPLLALPIDDGALCRTCHSAGP